MSQAGLMTGKIPVLVAAIIVKSEILIIIAKMDPVSFNAVPFCLSPASYLPVWKGRFVKCECFGNVVYDQV